MSDELWEDFEAVRSDELTLHLDRQETYVLSILVAGKRLSDHPLVQEVRERLAEKLRGALVDKGVVA